MACSNMKIHGLCIVKNEADIIDYFLRKGSEWCDNIYVLDTGSSDDTWERVLKAAETNKSVIPFKKEDLAFSDSLRSLLFNHFKGNAKKGDWWCRMDSDEFYVTDPRKFLSNVSWRFHVVWAAHLQYYFTEKDLEFYESKEDFETISTDMSHLPEYYVANASEPRFFRHRDKLDWPGGAWPRHLGVVAPERILVRHYQYRSPSQIQMRLDTRRKAAESGWQHFQHSLEKDWREKVIQSNTCHRDIGDGNFIVEEKDLPRHLESPSARLLKQVLHMTKIFP